MKRIVFELIFIATTWYIFLPPLNLTSWEFLFFLCGHLLVVAVLFGFGKGINLVKTVHVRHGKAEADLKSRGFQNQSVRENPFSFYWRNSSLGSFGFLGDF